MPTPPPHHPSAPPSGAETLLDQAYDHTPAPATAGTRRALDLHVPAGPGPFPLVVWIHGGGWHLGDRRIDFAPLFTDAGLAVASLGYRLTNAGHPFPAQIEDCAAGLDWLMKNAAAHRIDAGRIGLIGHSAGAHLSALLLACGASGIFSRAKVRAHAAVLWSPPLDLALGRGRWPASSPVCNPADPFQKYFSPTGAYDETFCIYASPATYLGPGLPPLLVVHHERDPLVPVGQTGEFVRRARALGADITYRVDTRDLDDPHAIPCPALFDEALDFFRRKLAASA